MSGLESCAISEPSMYSTSECTMLCGWMTTSIAPGGKRRGESGRADDRGHHHVAATIDRDLLERRGAEEELGAALAEVGRQFRARRVACEHRIRRPVLATEGEQRIGRAVRREREDPIAIGVARRDVERALADGTGGAEDCQIHGLANERSSAATGSTAAALSTRSRMPPWPGSSAPLSL